MRSYARYPDEIELIDFHWLAGLLEGESTFMAGPPSSPGLPILAVAMIDRDVIDRVGSLIGARTVAVRARKRGWKNSYVVSLRGSPAVAWMRALHPVLGRRRRQQIARALRDYEPSPNRLSRERVWQALELLEAGRSVTETAAHIGISKWAIYDLRLGRSHCRWADQWRARKNGDEDGAIAQPARYACPRGESR